MKKITLSFIAAIATVTYGYSQVNVSVLSPTFNATSNVRAPNGTSGHTSQRGCFLVKPSELNYLTTGMITTFGFSLNVGNVSVPVTGNFTVWLETTSNTSYLKGTNWSTIIPGTMTQAYVGNMTIPVGNAPAPMVVTLTGPGFPYTAGSGLYVAYNWTSNGPFDAGGCVYQANNDMNPATGGASSDDVTLVAPTTLTATTFRPCFIFGGANTTTNDIEVIRIIAPGKLAKVAQVAQVEIRNRSNVALSNVSVGFGVTGANTVGPLIGLVPSILAGAIATVNIPSFSSPLQGVQSLSAGVLSDQNNTNNAATWSQSVTCDVTTYDPNIAASNYVAGLGFTNGNLGIFVHRITSQSTGTIKGMNIAIGQETVNIGKTVYGVLLSSIGLVLATTNTITLTNAQVGTFVRFDFATPPNVTLGTDFYLGCTQTAPNTFPIGTASAPITTIVDRMYIITSLVGGALTQVGPINGIGYFGIEAVHTTTAPVISAVTSKTVLCKGAAATLSATGGASYVWTSLTPASTSSIISVSPAVTTTYTIVGTDVDGCSNKGTFTQSVTICTGLMVNSVNGSEIKMFPNPAVNGKSIISGLNGVNRITVYNILGQNISTQTSTEESATIDLANQPVGTYLIKITDESNNSKTLKIINQN